MPQVEWVLRPHFTQSAAFNYHFEVESPMNTEVGASKVIPGPFRTVTSIELYHYNQIFLQSALQDQNYFTLNKESHAHALLHDLSCHVRQKSQPARLKL